MCARIVSELFELVYLLVRNQEMSCFLCPHYTLLAPRSLDWLCALGSDGSPVAVDVSVVCGLQTSRSSATPYTGARAKQRELQKKSQYDESCRAVGWGFMPFVVETTGAWGSEAHKLVS